MKIPAIVNVWILISSIASVNVTVIPDGMMIEHLPEGTSPLAHVVERSNAPDWTAVYELSDTFADVDPMFVGATKVFE